jgi:hypothetical protein
MFACDFADVDRFLERHSVAYALEGHLRSNSSWAREYADYWNIWRLADPVQRMDKLLEIVRYNRWNMNRQGQCEKIQNGISRGEIGPYQLAAFWSCVDGLSRYRLREMPAYSPDQLAQMKGVLDGLLDTLCEWHPSAGTITFLSKVILMFNWGETPALDQRVRSVLGLRGQPLMSTYVEILKDLGSWVTQHERREGVRLDQQVTDYMVARLDGLLGEIPIGRALDMVLFPLADYPSD